MKKILRIFLIATILFGLTGCLEINELPEEEKKQLMDDLKEMETFKADVGDEGKVLQEDLKEYFINGKRADDGSVEIAGCVANGIPAKAAEVIFEDMVTFASYARFRSSRRNRLVTPTSMVSQGRISSSPYPRMV